MKKRPARTALPSPAGSVPAGGTPSPVPSSPRAMAPAVVDLSAMAEAIMKINERLTVMEEAAKGKESDEPKFTEADQALVQGFITKNMERLFNEAAARMFLVYQGKAAEACKLGYLGIIWKEPGGNVDELTHKRKVPLESSGGSHEESIGL